MNDVRNDFPILHREVNGKSMAYLDNAATTQKPKQVIDALSYYYSNHNANVHRGVHTLSQEATEQYEAVRAKIAGFINARPQEIIFTRNATESLNLVAFSLGLELQKDDEIITTVMEHHSNIVPWQMLESRGVRVRYLDIDNDGRLDIGKIDDMINSKTRIVAVSHVSNLLGTINPVKKISRIVHDSGAKLVVDGAQGAPHMPVDMTDLDADFYAFSAHKMLGPTGIGILFGKERMLEEMQPFLRGGDMIKEVTMEKTTFNDVPYKFEAGTPNIADAIAFGKAIDYLHKLGMHDINMHEKQLTDYAIKRLSEIKNVRIYGPHSEERGGIVSFNVGDIHSHDVASLLDAEGIAIRSGHGCAMPLVHRLGATSVCRASFYVYNNRPEIDRLADGIEKAKRVFKV